MLKGYRYHKDGTYTQDQEVQIWQLADDDPNAPSGLEISFHKINSPWSDNRGRSVSIPLDVIKQTLGLVEKHDDEIASDDLFDEDDTIYPVSDTVNSETFHRCYNECPHKYSTCIRPLGHTGLHARLMFEQVEDGSHYSWWD